MAEDSRLVLSVVADSKYGLAFTLGGLLALRRAGLLSRVAVFHGGGQGNLLLAQLLAACRSVSLATGESWQDVWNRMTRGKEPEAVSALLVEPLLLWCCGNQEYEIHRASGTACCFPWTSAPWQQLLARHMNSASDWADSISYLAQQEPHVTLPIVNCHAACEASTKMACLTTDPSPASHAGLPIRYFVPRGTDVCGFLAASVCPAEDGQRAETACAAADGAVSAVALMPAWDMDALGAYSSDVYYMKLRLSRDAAETKDCAQWLVLDACTDSPYARAQTSIPVRYHTTLGRADALSSRDGREERPTCYRSGLVSMHPSDSDLLAARACGLEADAVRVPDAGDTPLGPADPDTWRQCVNAGYTQTLRTYALQESRAQPDWGTPPFPDQ